MGSLQGSPHLEEKGGEALKKVGQSSFSPLPLRGGGVALGTSHHLLWGEMIQTFMPGITFPRTGQKML